MEGKGRREGRGREGKEELLHSPQTSEEEERRDKTKRKEGRNEADNYINTSPQMLASMQVVN